MPEGSDAEFDMTVALKVDIIILLKPIDMFRYFSWLDQRGADDSGKGPTATYGYKHGKIYKT